MAIYVKSVMSLILVITIVLITKTSQKYIMHRDPIYTSKYTVKPVLRGQHWDKEKVAL